MNDYPVLLSVGCCFIHELLDPKRVNKGACLLGVWVTLGFKDRKDIVIDLDGVNHEAQESRRILDRIHRRDRVLVLTHRLPVMLNLLDIVVRCQDINDAEVVEILSPDILFIRR